MNCNCGWVSGRQMHGRYETLNVQQRHTPILWFDGNRFFNRNRNWNLSVWYLFGGSFRAWHNGWAQRLSPPHFKQPRHPFATVRTGHAPQNISICYSQMTQAETNAKIFRFDKNAKFARFFLSYLLGDATLKSDTNRRPTIRRTNDDIIAKWPRSAATSAQHREKERDFLLCSTIVVMK